MANASELLRDAQYAYQNVSHGSTDSKRYAAKAKSLARRIVRKFPNSQEAAAARSILEHLGERVTTRKSKNQHDHVARDNQHHWQQQQEVRPPSDSDNRIVLDKRTDDFINQCLLPGWPLRLLQTISVVVGVILAIKGLNGFSISPLDIGGLLAIVIGGFLIYLPRMAVFTEIVDKVKTRILVNQPWDSDSSHMPSQRDLSELVAALVIGNNTKRIALLLAFFLLSGFLVVSAAIFYVVGIRKAFDSVEGWLLDRSVAEPSEMEGN